jgi:sialate O-acetylesterase
MKLYSIKKIVLGIVLSCFSLAVQAQENVLKLADPLTGNMVVQQNQPFTIWGTAKPGAEVNIAADWTLPVTVLADAKGQFKGIIPVIKAEKGNYKTHTLSVSSGKEKAELSNLLIGELWICSGQSNMQFSMKEVPGAVEELAAANKPNIRLFSTQLNFSDTPLSTVTGKWEACTPETAEKFSAVGYYFGSLLQKELDVPVGLLWTGIGASAAQAYVPTEVLAADPLLNETYLQPYLASDKSKEVITGGFSFEKVTRPYLLYNAMIHPFINLSIKGVVWYQGESNHNERESYTHLMHKMIGSWREAFGQGNFPFYYVQIAPYYHDKEDPSLAGDAFFREAQEKVSALSNTQMVLTMDVGEAKDLHPKNKKPIGMRLAKVALNRTYGQLDVAYRGPQFDYAEFKKGEVTVHYYPETVGAALQTNDGKAPKYFEVAGEDKKFYPADAVIVGAKIVVTSKKVKHPVAVRYAFTNYPVTNLENNYNFPAVPFRSDTWEEVKK